MTNDLTKIYDGDDLSGATSGVIYLPIVRAATLTAVRVGSDEAAVGDVVFEVQKNGAVITGLTALTIEDGDKSGIVSGLNVALVSGDEIVLNLLSGDVSAPLTLNLVVETDGDEITAADDSPLPIGKLWLGTQEDYDDITSPDDATLYFIQE